MPVVICQLASGESMITEKGSMVWMSPNIEMQTSAGGIGKAFGRMFSGESIFQNIYTARAARDDRLCLQLPRFHPGGGGHGRPPDGGAEGRLPGSGGGVELSIFFQKKTGAGFFGGEGFIMQKLSGRGKAFVEIDGSAVEYELKAGEKMVVDSGNLAMMDATCSIDIQTVKGVKTSSLAVRGCSTPWSPARGASCSRLCPSIILRRRWRLSCPAASKQGAEKSLFRTQRSGRAIFLLTGVRRLPD